MATQEQRKQLGQLVNELGLLEVIHCLTENIVTLRISTDKYICAQGVLRKCSQSLWTLGFSEGTIK
jgi:hypothetical protein